MVKQEEDSFLVPAIRVDLGQLPVLDQLGTFVQETGTLEQASGNNVTHGDSRQVDATEVLCYTAWWFQIQRR